MPLHGDPPHDIGEHPVFRLSGDNNLDHWMGYPGLNARSGEKATEEVDRAALVADLALPAPGAED